MQTGTYERKEAKTLCIQPSTKVLGHTLPVAFLDVRCNNTGFLMSSTYREQRPRSLCNLILPFGHRSHGRVATHDDGTAGVHLVPRRIAPERTRETSLERH